MTADPASSESRADSDKTPEPGNGPSGATPDQPEASRHDETPGHAESRNQTGTPGSTQTPGDTQVPAHTEPEEHDGPDTHFWLTRRDQWLVAAVTVLALVMLGVKWFHYSYVDRSAVVLERAGGDIGYRIDLNTATWIELTQLRGIGETYAKRIVANREANGPYPSLDELQRVKGIGPKTVAKNRRWLKITAVPHAKTGSAKPGSAKQTPTGSVNTAD